MDEQRKVVVATPDAPAAVGAYSQAVVANGFIFLSGQVPLDPATGKLIPSIDPAEQARQVMRNLHAVLQAAGADFSYVVRAGIFLADINDFAAVNEVYAEAFEDGVKPARATIQVGALPLGAKVEIEMTALVPLTRDASQHEQT